MPRAEYTNYEIREVRNTYGGDNAVIIEVCAIESLPGTLRRLAEMGYDMAPSLDALTKAVEEQRKRKALDAAVADLAKKNEA